MPQLTLALSYRDEKALTGLGEPWDPVRTCLHAIGPDSPLADLVAQAPVSRLYLGSEFCEHLLPSAAALDRAATFAATQGLALALATPIASDGTHDRLRRLLPRLPAGTEVIVNDWGSAGILKRDHPALVPVAGRLLCKMIKDPRLPSPTWTGLYPHGIGSPGFRAVLARLGIARLEMDLPPFAQAEAFRGMELPVGVHARFGYVTKGRMCRIGSLHLPAHRKFAPGHACRRECLDYRATSERPNGGSDLPTVQQGNTLYYRHTADMARALAQAVASGWISRLIIPGDSA